MAFAEQAKRRVLLLVGVILIMILSSTAVTVQAKPHNEIRSQENIPTEAVGEMVEIEEDEVPLEAATACTAHWGVLALLGCYVAAGVVGIRKKSDMRLNVMASAIFAVALAATGFFWKCRVDLYLTVVSGAVAVAFSILNFAVDRNLFTEEK